MNLEEDEREDLLGIGNLKIIQNKKYFCFGVDSVLLANYIVLNSNKNVIVDLCSGSGVISVIASAKKKCLKIFSVELQEKMYDLLEKNIHVNSLEDKIIPIKEDVKNYDSIRKKIVDEGLNGAVDIVVCNPPYKTVGTGCVNPLDVKYIARHEVFCNLDDIFKTSSKLLNNTGKLYIVHKPERLVDLFCNARKYNLEPKKLTMVQPTINKKPSIVLVEYVKNGGSELVVQKPIIQYNEDGKNTKEICEIYGIQEI